MRATSTLRQFQTLEDALRNGDINEAEFRTRRRLIKDTVEDAVAIDDEPRAEPSSPHEIPALWRIAAMIAAALGGATLIGAWLLHDVLLALTLSVTMLAALTMRAFKGLGE